MAGRGQAGAKPASGAKQRGKAGNKGSRGTKGWLFAPCKCAAGREKGRWAGEERQMPGLLLTRSLPAARGGARARDQKEHAKTEAYGGAAAHRPRRRRRAGGG